MILCSESLFHCCPLVESCLMLFLIDISFLWFIGFCTGLDSGIGAIDDDDDHIFSC